MVIYPCGTKSLMSIKMDKSKITFNLLIIFEIVSFWCPFKGWQDNDKMFKSYLNLFLIINFFKAVLLYHIKLQK